MMAELFGVFPYLENEKIVIRKMESSDVAALSEISSNDHIYKYIPPFLYKKNVRHPHNMVINTVVRNVNFH